MKLGPSQNEAELTAREIALNRLQGVDPDFGVTVSMLSVEMRVPVIVVEHPDRDPEKAAYAGHGGESSSSSRPLMGKRRGLISASLLLIHK
jgi:hypothetical protein